MFGFNLGCGFGNTDTASENMLFTKARPISWGRWTSGWGDKYMDPWHLTDREGRLDLTLTPCYDRTTSIKLLWVNNCCHQMFGKFKERRCLTMAIRLESKGM